MENTLKIKMTMEDPSIDHSLTMEQTTKLYPDQVTMNQKLLHRSLVSFSMLMAIRAMIRSMYSWRA